MKYIISNTVILNIEDFYQNVSKKYRHTYDYSDMHRDVDNAINSICQIENGLLRRQPTLSRWNGLFMANSNDRKWYFAYRIDGDTIYVEDACHAQNMHESKNAENLLRGFIMEEVRKCLHFV